jgi:hypothetical protein
MEYKVIHASSPNELSNKVNDALQNGYELIGSHQVVIRHTQNRFNGMVHTNTLNEIEYTQSVVKKDNTQSKTK